MYSGYIEPDSFDESMLTKLERENIDLIVKYEKEKGYR